MTDDTINRNSHGTPSTSIHHAAADVDVDMNMNMNMNMNTLLPCVQTLVRLEQSLTTTLEATAPLLSLPTPTSLSQAELILALARTYSTRTSAPPGWNPPLPVAHFATPSPLPHQLRGGALGAMQLKMVREKKKRKRLEEEEARARLMKEQESELEKRRAVSVPGTATAKDPKKKDRQQQQQQQKRQEASMNLSSSSSSEEESESDDE